MKRRPGTNDGVALAALVFGALVAVFVNPAASALFSFHHYFDLGRLDLTVHETAPGGGTRSVDARGAPFRISSMSSGFAVSGEYEGFVRLDTDGLIVSISSSAIQTRANLTDSNRLTGVRVGLARSTETSWRSVQSVPLHVVDRPLGPGESFELGGIEVVIPDVTAEDLDGSWLLITHELAVESNEPGGYSGPAWTYAHGERAF